MPPERAMSACSDVLLVAIERSAHTASLCASSLKPRPTCAGVLAPCWALALSSVPESHVMSGGMPPALARAVWLADESAARMAIALSTRTAPPGAVTIAMREVRRITSSLATVSRFSVWREHKLESAPTEHSCDRTVSPVTSKPTSGSMPPSLAMVALFGALSTESDQSAAADCSLTSADVPSRTRVHRGVTAPERTTPTWFSVLALTRPEMAPAALAWIRTSVAPSMLTSEATTPASEKACMQGHRASISGSSGALIRRSSLDHQRSSVGHQ